MAILCAGELENAKKCQGPFVQKPPVALAGEHHVPRLLIQSHLHVFHRTDVTSAVLHPSHLKQQKLLT